MLKQSRISPRGGNPEFPPENQVSSIKHQGSRVKHPSSPTYPILPRLPTIQALIMQNKPNSQKPKTTPNSCTTTIYSNIPLHPARKNKPNQTQSPGRSLIICPLFSLYVATDAQPESAQLSPRNVAPCFSIAFLLGLSSTYCTCAGLWYYDRVECRKNLCRSIECRCQDSLSRR